MVFGGLSFFFRGGFRLYEVLVVRVLGGFVGFRSVCCC